MDSLLILIPIALVFVALAIKLLLWAVGSGQYEDLDKEAYRILLDDDASPPEPSQAPPQAPFQAQSDPVDLKEQKHE